MPGAGGDEGSAALALYDMDKTITRRPSWVPWLFHYARTESPWRLLLAPLLLLLVLLHLLGFFDRARLKERTQALMMGRRAPRARVERAARSFAARFGARMERKHALEALAADRAAGRALWLATASCRFYAEALAERWGFDHVVATESLWDGDFLCPRILGENCYGMAKLRMILADLPARPGEARFASDHWSDLPALLWADRPVAVAPEKKLARIARHHGWPIEDWR